MGKKHNKPLQIAIDGPVAAGKGDIASRIAKKLHILYVYTGAMYRMLALACIEKGISCTDKEKVLSVLNQTSIDLLAPDKNSKQSFIAILNGKDVTERLIDQDVAKGASDVSMIPEVRTHMVHHQQKIAEGKSVVMEGRDIGLRVLPNAQLKIYLTASVSERAKRRFLQWKEKGLKKTLEETIEDTKIRDLQDMGRKTDPLQILPDAWKLDTTDMTQTEVIESICVRLKKLHLL